MERTVDAELLGRLLEGSPVLPSPEELAQWMVQVELNSLVTEGQQPVDEATLESAGWYFLGAASSPQAAEYYPAGLRRQAFQVAAHLLDLTLRSALAQDVPPVRPARLCFAAQVAYLRGFQQPNAAALYRKTIASGMEWPGVLADQVLTCLHLGTLFLAGDMQRLRADLRAAQRELNQLRQRWGREDLTPTWLGATANVVQGVHELVRFQRTGNTNALGLARSRFTLAVTEGKGEPVCRWVAALLLDLSADLEGSSPWTVLPPDTPKHVVQAFTQGQPPVLTLWPPQMQYLRDTASQMFALDARRQFLAAPTSAGKTLIAQLLVAIQLGRGGSGACVVVPTRSLSAEVTRNLRSRLGRLARVVESDLLSPDLDSVMDDPDRPTFLISVVTPEKLSDLLHRDTQAVLNRYDLFVFDEAHNVNNGSRGWLLESLITYLHVITRETQHRLMLMSAAVGNDQHFLQWLTLDGQAPYASPQGARDPWRAPRRLTAVYRTEIGAELERRPIKGKPKDQKVVYQLNGELRAPLFDRIGQVLTVSNVGQLILRVPGWKPMPGSTPRYETVVPLVDGLMPMGLVMTVIQNRGLVQRFAVKLAAGRPQVPVTALLRGLMAEVKRTLGEEHDLMKTLPHGVAFHHGELPHDLRLNLERAAAAGELGCLVCTTSLTEGVNLPVHAVVIVADENPGSAPLTPSQILNALGRAGRAAQETEGILVLVSGRREDNEVLLRRAQPDKDELRVQSVLTEPGLLEAFTALEEQISLDENALFSVQHERAREFVTFVWWVAAERGGAQEEVLNVIRSGFAAQAEQLSATDLASVERLALTVLGAYAQTPDQDRRRWAKASTSLGTSRRMDGWAQRLIDDQPLSLASGSAFLERTLELILPDLLTTPEVQRVMREKWLDWPHRELVLSWIAGDTLTVIAQRTQQSGVTPADLHRYMNGFVEFTLPWLVSATLERAVTLGGQWLVTPEEIPLLAATLRYGVPSVTMLPPIRDGRLSRQLAVRLWAATDREDSTVADVKSWLFESPLTVWAERLDLTSFDFDALLDFVNVGLSYEERSGEDWARVTVPGLDGSREFKFGVESGSGVPLVAFFQDGQTWHVAPQQQAAVRQAMDRGYEIRGWDAVTRDVWIASNEDPLGDVPSR